LTVQEPEGERDREKERERKRQREKERKRGREGQMIVFWTLTFLIGAILGFVVLALHERELPAERKVLLLPV